MLFVGRCVHLRNWSHNSWIRRRAKTRREDEDEKREEQLLFPFPAKEESFGSWTRITDRIMAIRPPTNKLVGWIIAPSTKRVLAALLIPVHLPQIFSFVPFGRGVHAPGLGSQGGKRASKMHTFPPNTHTCLI